MFENMLAEALAENHEYHFWMEDESQRIGKLHIPHPLWNSMRQQPVFFMDIPFEERLQFILEDYGTCDTAKMKLSIERIQKRLGPLETKNALHYLEQGNLKDCFEILLRYYDKHYKKGLLNRENVDQLLNKIDCSTVDINTNTQKLLECSASLA